DKANTQKTAADHADFADKPSSTLCLDLSAFICVNPRPLLKLCFANSQQPGANSPLLARDFGPLAQAGEERQGGLGRGGGVKRRADGLDVPRKLERTFAVHFYDGAVEFEAGKYAAGAGIAQHLRTHFPISVGSGV